MLTKLQVSALIDANSVLLAAGAAINSPDYLTSQAKIKEFQLAMSRYDEASNNIDNNPDTFDKVTIQITEATLQIFKTELEILKKSLGI